MKFASNANLCFIKSSHKNLDRLTIISYNDVVKEPMRSASCAKKRNCFKNPQISNNLGIFDSYSTVVIKSQNEWDSYNRFIEIIVDGAKNDRIFDYGNYMQHS